MKNNVFEELRWDARYTKKDLSRASRVSHTTIDKVAREGLGSIGPVHGGALVRALSDRLLKLKKIEKPLVYEEVLKLEEEEAEAEEEEASQEQAIA